MKISVVVCTRDRPDMIGTAIESIAECEYPNFDIHIMDQSTNTQTKEIIENICAKLQGAPPINYHFLEKAGLSRAYNSGIRVSDGDIVAFSDDDCILPKDWLSLIEREFVSDPEVDLLYGQVMIPKSLMEDAMTGKIIVPCLQFKRERLSLKDNFHVIGMGANMAIRRLIVAKVKGFDEALGGGGPLRSAQDYDFAYRTYKFGSAIILAPEVLADHYGTRLPEQWPVTSQNYGIGDGAFYAKHIRCGDIKAFWMLTKLIARSWAKELKSILTTGKWNKDLYGRFLFKGVKEASKFGIDKTFRLYVETEHGKMTVTNANAVTAATKDSSSTGS